MTPKYKLIIKIVDEYCKCNSLIRKSPECTIKVSKRDFIRRKLFSISVTHHGLSEREIGRIRIFPSGKFIASDELDSLKVILIRCGFKEMGQW